MLAAALLLLIAGCTRTVDTASVPPIPDEVVSARMLQQAHDILDRWEAAYALAKKPVFAPTYGVAAQFVFEAAYAVATKPIFVPRSDLVPKLVGPNAAADERTIFLHPIVTDVDVPVDSPGPAELRWPDGRTRSVNTLSATQVFDAMRDPRWHPGSGGCYESSCAQVHVTGARYTTAAVDTVDGPVTVPVWEFTFGGFTSRAIAPAFSKDEVWPAPQVPPSLEDPLDRVGPASVKSTSDGRVLTVEYLGAVPRADQMCGADHTVEAFLSEHAVAVAILERPYIPAKPLPPDVGCGDGGSVPHTATVELPQPLGSRVALGLTGRPVRVIAG
jgi:hypothetical protein